MDSSRVGTRWLIVVPTSVLLGLLFAWWNVPAGWILAGILAAGAAALLGRAELPLNTWVNRVGRGTIGMLAGIPLAGVPLAELAGYLAPGLVVAVVIVAAGILGGLLLARMEPEISRETGVLSMLAGGSSVMPVMARELGADFRYVALSQYLRLLIVSMTLPLITAFFAAPGAAGGVAPPVVNYWMFPVVLLIAFFGADLGRLLRLPSPGVFGPLLITVALGLVLPVGWSLQPPEFLRVFAFLVVDWMCGGALSLPALKLFARQLPATLIFIVGLSVVCALLAIPLVPWVGITYFEAYLATSPGAIETALALSSEGGAGPSVVAIQLIRLLGVLLIAGYLPQILRLFHRDPGSGGER
ncbi:AbrB family transcriptional regulator [Corynebacterium sp. YIM 101645]|uniref:AbrB family transcriptional regulator n=1 Tax=Corynebacterium lemuris TaxID=1859292 RepID=A0ABT2FW49_9CORY|nr:AbrB family transcriptional regulator [Corynebacterium lemuris]MCS5478189.1 AbrB family transcriptional regulator [Corynebacterium lemuris]